MMSSLSSFSALDFGCLDICFSLSCFDIDIRNTKVNLNRGKCFMSKLVKITFFVTALNLVLAMQVVAGPPFLTDDPEPVDYQHWEAYLFTLGDHSGSYNVQGPAVELNYGVLPETPLHLI